MFAVNLQDLCPILKDFGVAAAAESYEELQRYDYEKSSAGSRNVRLILRVRLKNGASLVVRFKNEPDVNAELIESQNCFAEILRRNGIPTPVIYRSEGATAKWYELNGYAVIVTVEEFVLGEVKCVDKGIAAQTGALLAKMHNISESNGCHVSYPVLFNPFTYNDLFSYAAFQSIASALTEENLRLHANIAQQYMGHMAFLAPLKAQPRYAVQGDISDCNLFLLKDGSLGVFDYNRCGDNNLFCDAVMQAVFEARLMDYPPDYDKDREEIMLSAFLRGYHAVRPFTDAQQGWFPHLYAIIDAFWSAHIKYDENSLLNACKRKDRECVQQLLKSIETKITTTKKMPI